MKALDPELLAGRGGESEVQEMMRLVWPFYFGDPEAASPMPVFRSNTAVYAGTWDSIREHFARGILVDGLPRYTGPAFFVHGGKSPIPVSESEKSASLIDGARLEAVAEAGHFPWLERPVSVAGPVRAIV